VGTFTLGQSPARVRTAWRTPAECAYETTKWRHGRRCFTKNPLQIPEPPRWNVVRSLLCIADALQCGFPKARVSASAYSSGSSRSSRYRCFASVALQISSRSLHLMKETTSSE
jgi:hypothetical protein